MTLLLTLNCKTKSFNPGQIYVALSHVTSFQGPYILGDIEDKHIKANPKVHFEYQRSRQLETENSTTLGYRLSSLPTNAHHKLSICVLNVWSLKKHSIDIKCDVNLMISNVLALTKTQLFPHDPDVDIQENLKPSQGSCTFSGQKFKVFSRTFQDPN